MAGLLSKIGSPGKYVYDKFRKERSESKAQNKAVKKGQKMAIKKEEKAYPVYKRGLKELEAELRGKHALPSDLGDIMERFQRAGKGAEEFFAPIKENALAEFEQYGIPQITNRFRDTGGSSAMNQALAAARTNLSRQLASDFAGFQTNLASSLLNQSQQAKLANQQHYGNLANAAIGQPSAYLPPTQLAPTGLQKWGPLLSGVIGGIGGGLTAGPGGAVTGFQSGTQIGNTLFQ